MADIFDDDRWMAEEPKENFGQVIHFPKRLHRALVIEFCGNGKWCAAVRSGPRWTLSWRTAPDELDVTIRWGRHASEDYGIPLLILEPGKPYRTIPRWISTPPRRLTGGAA